MAQSIADWIFSQTALTCRRTRQMVTVALSSSSESVDGPRVSTRRSELTALLARQKFAKAWIGPRSPREKIYGICRISYLRRRNLVSAVPRPARSGSAGVGGCWTPIPVATHGAETLRNSTGKARFSDGGGVGAILWALYAVHVI